MVRAPPPRQQVTSPSVYDRLRESFRVKAAGSRVEAWQFIKGEVPPYLLSRISSPRLGPRPSDGTETLTFRVQGSGFDRLSCPRPGPRPLYGT